MENRKWVYSFDEECWSGDNEYPTKEEAISAAREAMNEGEKQTFWVGTKNIVDEKYLLDNAKLFSVEDLNEALEEVCTDEDCYLKSDNELEEELRGIIAKFIIEKFGKNITWLVEDCEEVI